MVMSIRPSTLLCIFLGTLGGISVATGEDTGQPKKLPDLLKLRVDETARIAEERRQQFEEKQRDLAELRKQKKLLGDPIDDPADKHAELEAKRNNVNSAMKAAAVAASIAIATLTTAENDRRYAANHAETQGVSVSLTSDSAPPNPLGPNSPHNHVIHGGSLFEKLKKQMAPDHKTDPDSAGPRYFDGTDKTAVFVDVILGNLESARAEVHAQQAKEAAEAERVKAAARVRAAREADQRRIAADAEAKEKRAREIEIYVAKLERAVNNHIESAGSVNTADPAAVQRYNDTTDYYIREYKKYTGIDLTYKYKVAP